MRAGGGWQQHGAYTPCVSDPQPESCSYPHVNPIKSVPPAGGKPNRTLWIKAKLSGQKADSRKTLSNSVTHHKAYPMVADPVRMETSKVYVASSNNRLPRPLPAFCLIIFFLMTANTFSHHPTKKKHKRQQKDAKEWSDSTKNACKYKPMTKLTYQNEDK